MYKDKSAIFTWSDGTTTTHSINGMTKHELDSMIGRDFFPHDSNKLTLVSYKVIPNLPIGTI